MALFPQILRECPNPIYQKAVLGLARDHKIKDEVVLEAAREIFEGSSDDTVREAARMLLKL